MAEFAVNNKIHSATKMSSFIATYDRELRIEVNIRRKGKVEKAMEFVENMKKILNKVVTALRKTQEEIKQQADKKRKEAEEWKKSDKVMLSTKDFVFKERPVKKLVD